MVVEFISATPTNSGSEWAPTGDTSVNPEFIVRYAKTLDDNEFNYTLIPYWSSKQPVSWPLNGGPAARQCD